MTAEGLETVLTGGREARATYYEGRAYTLESNQRRSLAKVFVDVPEGEFITATAILAPLTQEYGFDEAH